MKILKFGIVMLLSMALWGCGKGNSSAPVTVDPVTQKAHPDPAWLSKHFIGNKTAAAKSGCIGCHGSFGTESYETGGIVKVSCVRCHPNGFNGSSSGGCIVCHATLPKPTSNKHSKHLTPNLPDIACGTCHIPDPVLHTQGGYTPVPVFDNSLFGEGTGISFSGGVCSNVSCHGGKPSPNWSTGTVTNCLECHTVGLFDGNPVGASYINAYNGNNTITAGTADPDQINWFNTGALNLHDAHVNALAIPCSDCHAFGASTNHFGQISLGKRNFNNDAQGKGFAASTLTGSGITGGYVGGTCAPACHPSRNWFQ